MLSSLFFIWHPTLSWMFISRKTVVRWNCSNIWRNGTNLTYLVFYTIRHISKELKSRLEKYFSSRNMCPFSSCFQHQYTAGFNLSKFCNQISQNVHTVLALFLCVRKLRWSYSWSIKSSKSKGIRSIFRNMLITFFSILTFDLSLTGYIRVL